jgi:hypothetical protein
MKSGIRREQGKLMLEPGADIDAPTTPLRNMVEFVRQLQETGQPVIITIGGKAELVVEDATSVRKLLKLVDRLETIEGVRAGLEEMKAGMGRPAEELFEELRQEFDIPRDA